MGDFTSRQRVAAALEHREADRVPIDVGGSRVPGMSAIAYKNLLEALGHREDIRLYDIKQQLAMVSLEIGETLGMKARTWVERNRDWDVLVERYIAAYAQLLGRKSEADS